MVETIVSALKHADLNAQIQDGYTLIQEVCTKFVTTFDIVQRYIKSSCELREILLSNTGEAVNKINNSILLLRRDTQADCLEVF